jgi:hypothetical protein
MTVIELQNDGELLNYEGKHGFVIRFQPESNGKRLEELCINIKSSGITDSLPETVFRFRGFWGFVYSETATFNYPDFFRIADHVGSMTGAWQVEGLAKLLTEHPANKN